MEFLPSIQYNETGLSAAPVRGWDPCRSGQDWATWGMRTGGSDATRTDNMIAALVLGSAALTVVATPTVLAQSAIIIDHNCTGLGQVPAAWITQAKSQLKASYGHTSHGSQIISGMDVIKNPAGSLYWWDHNGTQGGSPVGLHSVRRPRRPDYSTWATLTRQMLNGYGATGTS